MAIDRETLRGEMELHRAEIERRQIELDNDHESIMAAGRATLERAQEAEPLRYTRPIYTPVVTKAVEPAAGNIPDEWIDAVAIALAATRDKFQAAVEKAQTPLCENIARLEGQLATLMALLGEKPTSKRRGTRALPPPPLRLAK